MKIGIIGAGNIGGTIARKLVAAGHSVKLAAAEGPDEIRERAEKIGATAVAVADVVKDVNAIIVSIPSGAIPEVADVLAQAPVDVVVIDTSNYYPQFGVQIAEIDAGKTESIWSSEQLGRPVVKGFNAALAYTLAEKGKPAGAVGRIAIPVSGDDARAKTIACELVEAAGFDALDAGDLAISWRHQPGTPAYCTELTVTELKEALTLADKGRAPHNRDAVMQELMAASSPPSHDQIVARNREITAPR
ncbi:3-hydroxyisobutyrate dehydrogenase [Sphingobium lactosutens]|uniref:NADPH-dependent F420 reductase n=1 Tax=Sphingobium lactosutens TaxID=522773 RepID=UPI0015BAFEE7|nr:NAD(P)-binding domain-containing protein [Sphingobium lactosutens]NWK94315.1 3-hydroxyisobutyrate dehydrogenase [Sphingobium lactosutens]